MAQAIDQLPSQINQVLQKQHEELQGQLDSWLRSLSDVIQVSQSLQLDLPAELIPRFAQNPQPKSSKSKLSVDFGLSESSVTKPLSEDSEQQINEFTIEAQGQDSDGTLDSYGRAQRQGTIVDNFNKSVSEEAATAQRKTNACQKWCAKIMKSQAAEVLFAVAILTNSIFLGVELEWKASNYNQRSLFFFVLNLVYASIFLLEVCLGLIAHGPRKYFCSRQIFWNYLDTFVVAVSWTELFFAFFSFDNPSGLSSTSLRMLRLIKVSRVLRILRVLRVVKIVHYVRPLRTLVTCVVDTSKSFIWALILLLLMIYVFALLFTDAVLSYAEEQGSTAVTEQLVGHFGSVYGSITTLFQSISNGLDWNEASSVLEKVDNFWVLVFYLYIAFTSFVLLNVMTGVFCNSAIKAAENDHEMVIQSLMQSRKNFQDLVKNLFHRIDDLGLGMITISEFEKHFNDVAVRAFFEFLEMGAVDAWTLFASLDADGDHVISLNDFVERCTQLHGPARSVDLYSLKQLTAKLRQELQVIGDKVNDRCVPRCQAQVSRSLQKVHETSETFLI